MTQFLDNLELKNISSVGVLKMYYDRFPPRFL